MRIIISPANQMKDFNWSGYHYDSGRSSDEEYVFIREEVQGKG